MARLIKTDPARQAFIYAPSRQNECQLPVEIIPGRLCLLPLSCLGAGLQLAERQPQSRGRPGFQAAGSERAFAVSLVLHQLIAVRLKRAAPARPAGTCHRDAGVTVRRSLKANERRGGAEQDEVLNGLRLN